MTKLKLILTIAIASLVLGQSAQAVKIVGDIGFAGQWAGTGGLDVDSYTGITVSSAHTEGAGTGDYSSVPHNTTVTFSSIDLNANSVDPLWSFSYNLVNYSFEATSYIVQRAFNSIISVVGVGIARIDGFEDTYGEFSFTANQNNTAMTFSSGASVPDSGATAALLGLGLVGLATAARRFKR